MARSDRSTKRKHIKTQLEVRMSRVSGGADCFRFDIADRTSGLLVAEFDISPEEFADLLSNRQITPKGDVYTDERFGKKQVVERMLVPLQKHNSTTYLYEIDSVNQTAKKMLAERKDGPWDLDEDKTFNMHRTNTKGSYEVTIRTWRDK
jgi:hypothetical protein